MVSHITDNLPNAAKVHFLSLSYAKSEKTMLKDECIPSHSNWGSLRKGAWIDLHCFPFSTETTIFIDP